MPSLPVEFKIFLLVFISHWQSYITGGAVTAVITLVERWREKTLPKRIYFIIFAVTFAMASFFMAWRDQFERAERLQISLNAKPQQPAIQVNVPPISVPPAQVVIQGTSDTGFPKQNGPGEKRLAEEIQNYIGTGVGIQEYFVKTDDLPEVKKRWLKWRDDTFSYLKQIGPSYAVQFDQAHGSAFMGCPNGRSVEGCGYWQDIQGKNDTLSNILGELRRGH